MGGGEFYNGAEVKLSPFGKGLILVLLAILLVGGVVFTHQVLLGDTFNKEEAQHALYAFWLTRDLQALDWGAFFYDTQRQMVWPFLHSWVLTLFFLVFGVSYFSARLLSFVLFLSLLFFIYFFSTKVCAKEGPKIGVFSVLLALTSPLMLRFAAQNTLEGISALLFLAAAYVYILCEERKIMLEYVFLAVLIGLSIYTNYLYAYLMLPAFLVVTLSKLGPLSVDALRLYRRGEKAALHFIWWAYKKLIVALVLLLLALVWFSFSFSRKIQLMLTAIFRYSQGVQVDGIWQNLIYYPRAIVSSLSFSPWFGILMFVCLFLPFIAARYRGVNRLFVYAWTVLLLLLLTIPTKEPRLIFIIAPFIFIIFAAAAVYFLDILKAQQKLLGALFLLFLFLPAVPSLPRAQTLFFPFRPAQNMVQVLDFFHAGVPKDKGVAVSLNLQHLNPEVVRFHFRDWQAPVLAEPGPDEAALLGEAEYFFTIGLSEGSYYAKEVLDDSLFRWDAWLRDNERRGELRRYSSKRFESIGLTAWIYQKPSFGR